MSKAIRFDQLNDYTAVITGYPADGGTTLQDVEDTTGRVVHPTTTVATQLKPLPGPSQQNLGQLVAFAAAPTEDGRLSQPKRLYRVMAVPAELNATLAPAIRDHRDAYFGALVAPTGLTFIDRTPSGYWHFALRTATFFDTAFALMNQARLLVRRDQQLLVLKAVVYQGRAYIGINR